MMVNDKKHLKRSEKLEENGIIKRADANRGGTITFAELLKNHRKELGLTQTQFGALFGKTQSTIAMYENEKNIPDVKEVFEIADALDLHLNDLLDAIYYQCNRVIRKNKEIIIDLENLPSDYLANKYKIMYKGEEVTVEEAQKMLKQMQFERLQKEREDFMEEFEQFKKIKKKLNIEELPGILKNIESEGE